MLVAQTAGHPATPFGVSMQGDRVTTFYNENDPYAAQWIRNLSDAGHVARGSVDGRSIRDLRAADVREYEQCHFFAGVGVWSYALRLAGWPDTAPVWTGSCPCQPFSTAGRRGGFADVRHLWPDWFELIRQCRPPVILGEQVASPDGLEWLDSVSTDLENEGYALGAADLCAAGVGAPHIRQRLFFVAISDVQRREGLSIQLRQREPLAPVSEARWGGEAVGLANAGMHERGPRRPGEAHVAGAKQSPGRGHAVQLGDASGAGGRRDSGAISGAQGEGASEWGSARRVLDQPVPSGSTRGFWEPADWLECRDGKARPVEPGSFPLAHGAPARVGRLRAYGNAINAEVAATFIRAAMESRP